MIRTKRPKSKPMPAAYAELIALFPLRPLHDEVDYDNALEVAECLLVRSASARTRRTFSMS